MINQLFEQLATDAGRKFKEDLLGLHKNNVVLKEVVRLALDPAINFYIKKIPAYCPRMGGGVRDLSWAIAELDRLAVREVTGKDAIEFLTAVLEQLSSDDAEVIEKIIQRDLRCGVSEATANKVWKGLIPEYPYQRCCLPKAAKLDKFSWTQGVFSQLKADGMFVNINHLEDGTVELISRSGSRFPIEQFANLADEIRMTFPAGTQTHGELIVEVGGELQSREISNGLLNSVLKGGSFDPTDFPVLFAWDQLPIEAAVPGGKYNVPYADRYRELEQQIHAAAPHGITLIETKIVHSLEQAHEHYAEMLAAGYEGTIIKDRNAIWEDTTSKRQVKYKLEVDVDLKITGFTAGNGKNAELFGSITCETEDGELVVNVSGFKDKKQKGILTRAEIWEIRDQLIGTVMTVTSNNIMKPTKSNPKYSLFLPRFCEFRSDKSIADDLQRVQEQFENAVK